MNADEPLPSDYADTPCGGWCLGDCSGCCACGTAKCSGCPFGEEIDADATAQLRRT